MSLIAHYPLISSGSDVSGHGNNFSTSGSPSVTNGVIRKSTNFSAGYYYAAPIALEIRYDMTMSFWIYLTAYPASRMGICQTIYGAEIALNVTDTGGMQWYYGTSGVNTTPYTCHSTAAGAIPVGKWTHVTLVRDLVNSETRYYINGVQFGASRAITYQCAKHTAANLFQIGHAYTGNLNGNLEQFKIYDNVLSDDEILREATPLTLKFPMSNLMESANNEEGDSYSDKFYLSNSGCTLDSSSVVNQNRMDFNGTSDYLQIRDAAAVGWSEFDFAKTDYTIMLRVNFDTLSAAGGERVFDFANGSTSNNIILGRYTTTNKFYFKVYNGAASIGTLITTADSIYTGSETHITVVHSGANVYFYVNGVLSSQRAMAKPNTIARSLCYFGKSNSGDPYFDGKMSDFRLYPKGLSTAEIRQIYKTRARLTTSGDLQIPYRVETKYPDLVTDYNTWTVSSGSIGSFSQNGATAENDRYMGTGPFGESALLWRATPDAASGADGGWNHYFTQDSDVASKYAVRYSVWIKRTGDANGTTYFGCEGNVVYTLGGVVLVANPYFWSGDPPNYTDWFLYVGHIMPSTYAGTAQHPDTGIYNTSGTKVANTRYDFRAVSGITSQRHRTYLYWCTNTANRQYWAYPRVDTLDGTNPSLEDMFKGLDAKTSYQSTVQDDNRGDPFSVQGREVRISNNIKAPCNQWKLNGTGYDNISSDDGSISGAVPVVIDDRLAMAFTNDYMTLPNEIGYSSVVSLFCWFKQTAAPTGGYHIIFGGQELEISIPAAGSLRTGVTTSVTRFVGNSGSGLTDGEWHSVGFSFNGAQMVRYIDGASVGTHTGITGNLTYSFANRTMGRFGASTTYYLNGHIREARIYNKVLTPDEYALLHEMTKTEPTEMKLLENGIALKGDIIDI